MAAAQSPLWRWLITDLEGSGITFLDKLCSDRIVHPKLNEPLELSGTVPSDSPEINIYHTDNLPFLAEGVRQLYGFRRESDSAPYYTIRASTLILQVGDGSATESSRTRFNAWDPWQYLFFRTVMETGEACTYVPRKGADFEGHPIDIITSWLWCMLFNGDITAPDAALQCFIDWGQTGFYTGTMEYGTLSVLDGFHIEPGTSIGQAIQDICSTGYCDVVLEPIYDPINRPGILCQMSIYEQDPSDPNTGAGSFNYPAVFAWDRPGRSLVGFDDLFDGTQRANTIVYRSGQAGPKVTQNDFLPITDPDSIAFYGEYWAELSVVAQRQDEYLAVQSLASEQLLLRKTYKQTLTVNPAPERAPEPFVDYNIGDRVPIFIGTAQRGTYQLGDNSTRQPLPPGYTGVPPSPDPAVYVWQRVFGIPISIDDNGVETVRELEVGPIGAPPPAFGALIGAGGQSGGGNVAVVGQRPFRTGTTVRPGAPGIA